MWRHLIWDMGGTLIDTYPAVDRTFVEVCRDHGHDIPLGDVSLLTRRSIAEAGAELARRFAIPEARFAEAYAALKLSWRTTPAPVMSGARELLAYVRDRGGLNLVVTHRDRVSASDLLQGHGLIVDDLICAPDGFPRKPDPAMHQLAIQRHGLVSSECLAVGDRAIDAEAADAAGVPWVLLATPGLSVPVRVSKGRHITDLKELMS